MGRYSAILAPSGGPKMQRRVVAFLAFFMVALEQQGELAYAADAKPFITAENLDLASLLPPPPANDSAQTRAELGEVLTLQVTRTPEMEARAKADAVEDIWRFADIVGPKFT